jgi:glycerate dehydrogenase
MRIVILDGYTTNPGDLSWSPLEELGEVTIYDRTPPDKLVERIGDAEAVLTNKAVLTQSVLEACTSLRYVGIMATGINVIDLAAARSQSITVTNVPNYSSDSVSQFVFALLLNITNGVARHDEAVKAGEWAKSPDFTFQLTPQIELGSMTLGIFGLGAIGMRVAAIGRAFGMHVLAHSRRVQSGEHRGVEHVDFDTLLRESDVLTLHAPLTGETAGRFDKDAFRKMKAGSILINTARGGLVNEADLADALNSGHLYAAGIDVVSIEPISPDNPLLTAKNCLITPHLAFSAKASRQRLIRELADNLQRFMDGEPENVVS